MNDSNHENEIQDEQPKFAVNDKRHWVEGNETDEESDINTQTTFVEKLKQEAEEKDKRLREYIAAYKEKNSQNDEFRQRLQKENESRLDQAKANLFEKLVPILDNLVRASGAGKTNRDFDSLHIGVEMIIKQFHQQLQDSGVEIIKAQGRAFDPKTDEAFMTEETDDPAKDNQVVEDLEVGYRFKDKLIKPVKVKVAKLKST